MSKQTCDGCGRPYRSPTAREKCEAEHERADRAERQRARRAAAGR